MTDSNNTPPTPPAPEDPSSGLSANPDPAPEVNPHSSDPSVGSQGQVAPAPAPSSPDAGTGAAKGGRSGCMTTMIGLFVVLAAILGLVTQL